jgi:branched-chain amino acid transport system substrate-binding protein
VDSLWRLQLACGIATPGTAKAEFSDDVIKIGLITGMTGVSADNGGPGSVVAAQIAIDEFDGSINGTRIELLSADHQNKPDIGLSIARKWVDDDKIDVFVDISNSAIGLSIQELSRTTGIPALFSESNSSRITGDACSPYGVQWSFNTYAIANMVARAAVRNGANKWFFLSSEIEFGQSLQRDATKAIEEEGGEVVGSVRIPLGVPDASTFLLQARSSGADAIAIATPGFDTTTIVKQANEYGIRERGQQIIGLGISFKEVIGLGLEASRDVLVGEAYYWDLNDQSRAFGETFKARHGSMPSMYHASVYSSVKQYLAALDELGTDDGDAVMEKLRSMRISDAFITDGYIREDGQLIHDMYLFRVKAPDQSNDPSDVYDLVQTVPGEEAFQTLEQSDCPLLNN